MGNLKQTGNWSFTANPLVNNQVTGNVYDAAGNVTQENFGAGLSNSYAFNSEGTVTASNGVNYAYDALGQRISKDGGGAREYFYFGGVLLAMRDASGAWVDRLYGPSGAYATVSGTQSAVPVYRLTDHLGSLASLATTNGTLATATGILPYGQIVSDNSGDSFLFTDHERDSENGSDHTLFRQYSSKQGRWLSPDPYNGSYNLGDPQSLNRYAYVLNRPTVGSDPAGLDDNEDGSFSWSFGGDNFGGWSFGGFSFGADGFLQGQLSWYSMTPQLSAQASNDGGTGLDVLQAGLNGLGLIPEIGVLANGANAGISWARGDKFNAGLYAGAAALSLIAPGASAAVKGIDLLEEAEEATTLAKTASHTGEKLALGIDEHLDSFAAEHGASTWKAFEDPTSWKATVLQKLYDPRVRVLVNLQDVEVWEGLTRASRGAGGATDWELLQIRQNPNVWDSIEWFNGGSRVGNPFE